MAHQWIMIPVGRVCLKCSEAQAKGHFVEGEHCPNDKPFDPPPPPKE